MATHLLQGLELIVSAITDCSGIKEAVLSTMNEQRLGADYVTSNDPSTIFDIPIFYLMNSDDFKPEMCADLSEIPTGKIAELPESVLSGCSEDPELLEHCKECIKNLAKEGPLALGKLYARLGYETGFNLRVLHDAGLSWGTYEDALAHHCNAHANNLVIVPPAKGKRASGQLLAMLDFDMAFTSEEFKEFHKSNEGEDDVQKQFDDVLLMEKNAMMLCLGGDSLNSGADIDPVQMPSESLSLLQKGLRDTIVRHFLIGYEKAHTSAWEPIPSETERLCRPLIDLALCLTSSQIA